MNDQRGLVQRLERKLESAVEDAFARMFGGAVVPAELEAALRREAAAGVRSLQGNRLLAPNDYIITLGGDDYQNATGDPDLTATAFATHLAAYIGEQGWETYGDVVVRFQQSPNLHTGQVHARAAVNPDATPQSTTSECPPQSVHASTAESGVPPMTDNPSYRGGQGQDRPGDEYYDARAGQEPRGPYPPEPDQYPQDPRGAYPDQGQGGYPPRRPEQGGYPDQAQGGYAPGHPQQQPAGYGATPGFDPGYPQQQPPGGYAPPAGAQPGYPDYSQPPARHDDYAYPEATPEQRPAYPEQGGYDQGADYGRQNYAQPDYPQQNYPQQNYPPQNYAQQNYAQPDYAQPDYGNYPEQGGQGGYDAAPAGYGDAQGGYGYDQPAGGYDQPAGGYDQPAGGYDAPGGYGQRGYSASTSITLQLDDGSGRTYQLHDGSNVIGRGQDAQFRLPDTGVSRRHLEIRWDGRVALLSDLNSTNGTTVNNAPVQEWQLADGDVIRLGHSEIVVRVH